MPLSSIKIKWFSLFDDKIPVLSKDDMQIFDADEMAFLVKLNERLKTVEKHLCEASRRECATLDARIEDTDDPLSDYEIDAELYYCLSEDDPEYQEDADNILTKRTLISLKNLEQTSLDDGEDHRLVNIGDPFCQMEQCWLFHDLWDHEYGLDQRAVTAQEMLRIGEIEIDIVVRHQLMF